MISLGSGVYWSVLGNTALGTLPQDLRANIRNEMKHAPMSCIKGKDNNGEDDTKRRRPWDGEERPFWKRQFSCTLNARGFTYEGKGRTKQDAKNAAAEEASANSKV